MIIVTLQGTTDSTFEKLYYISGLSHRVTETFVLL